MDLANILIVAKTPALIEKIKECFSPQGHQVIPAYDLSLGFFLAQKNFPDLIICEPELNDGSFYDFLVELKIDAELAPIPFVLLDNTEDGSINAEEARSQGTDLIIDFKSENGYLISELLPLINNRIASKKKRQEYSPE